MSETFSVRIPKELKEKIEANPDDWSQEVRNFLTERVKQKELLNALNEIETRAEKRKTKIDSVTLIREDRERQD
ncbi:MAG: CopG family transcriptional regulator [Candidatus Bathyarchaeota archaeon]|nr:CopG family transcriptional regulator [Candidatus Bathyarchaeota archaeon]